MSTWPVCRSNLESRVAPQALTISCKKLLQGPGIDFAEGESQRCWDSAVPRWVTLAHGDGDRGGDTFLIQSVSQITSI